MTHKEQMTTDQSVWLNTDDYAQEVTYTPSGGSPTAIDAVVIRANAYQEDYVRGDETAKVDIIVSTTDVATPAQGDTFLIGTETFEVDPEQGVIEEDSDFLTIALRRRD